MTKRLFKITSMSPIQKTPYGCVIGNLKISYVNDGASSKINCSVFEFEIGVYLPQYLPSLV